MVTNKEKEIIIDAIRVLRSRRVRPSARKIAWYARREHLLSEATTEAVLDELVESEDVLRVEYKGATSYRVAASWSKAALVRRRPTRTKVNVMNSESTCRALRLAVASCGPGGASKEDIKDKLVACGQSRLVDKLDVLLHREIRAGTLLRVETTHRTATLITYVVPADAPAPPASPPSPALEEDEAEDTDAAEEILEEAEDDEGAAQAAVLPHSFLEIKTEANGAAEEQVQQGQDGQAPPQAVLVPPPSPSPSPHGTASAAAAAAAAASTIRRGMGGLRRGRRGRPPLKSYAIPPPSSSRGRTPSRRNKRAKKVFDPSEGGLGVPGRKKAVYRCDVCYQTVNQHSVQEDLLVCHRCSARAHPSCMGYSAELAVRSRLGPWTCMDCKHCAICNMDHNIGTLIFCDECDRAYHLTCHQPPLSEQLQGSWICYACSPQSAQNSYDCLPGLPMPRDSPVPDDESRGSSGSWDNNIYDPEIPNVTHWTVDQIIEYFDEKGFKSFSDVFREQDIDGTALLMLTRSDVLMGLNLKLGPALKIYRQIRILQTRLTNPPLP
ncbi:sterile alpha motif domain-containing protein 1-like [Penaeus indicus]|uniref:sterile alpha motif domain-containing protein 1-like n=1 Tax=Penaeus indicus TaxID=29960 RepID=UPI00300C2C76